MKYRHIETGEIREFVQGMDIHESWKPVHQFKSGRGTVTLSEVSSKSITSNKAKKAAETRAKNKAKAESKKRQLGAVEADVVVDKKGKSKLANLREKKAGK